MATQLQTIRTEILETAGLAADDARFPSATLTRIINRALRQIAADHRWPWQQGSETINTVANTEAYTPASNWAQTKRLQYEDRDLHEYSAAEAAEFANDTGAPQGYYIEEDQIHFVPVPDGVYAVTHIYHDYITALSGDTDTPELPDRYVDYLVNVALIQVAQRIRDLDLYSMADRERTKWKRRAGDEQRRSSGTTVPEARTDWSI